MPSFATDIEDKITELRGLYRLGVSPRTFEFYQVDWPEPTGTIYYTAQGQLDEMDVECPVSPVVCSVKPPGTPDSFLDIQITSSIGDEDADIEFWDFDGTISQYLVDHGEGIKVTVLYWFPDQDLLLPSWQAHLKLEDEAAVDILKLKAVNGFRDGEGTLPGGGHYQHCWSPFGGIFETQAEIDQHSCNYNLHLGGGIGTNDPSTGQPWTFCDRLGTSSCTARGVDPLRHYSHRTITATVFNGQTHGGNLWSTSQGNETNLADPPRVVMGTRRVYNCPVIAFRRDLNNNHPDQGWFYGLYEVGYGPHGSLSGARFKIDGIEQNANPLHYNYRLGYFGQTALSTLTPHGYSGQGLMSYNFGWTNPSKVDPSNASATVITSGLSDIKAYSDPDDLSSFVASTSSNRAWQLVRMLTDKTWGYGYDVSRLAIDTFIDTAEWCDEAVRYTDPFGTDWYHVRAASNVELIGKKIQEQFEDMCRAGRLSRPFLFNGKIHIVPLRRLTSFELAEVPVFYEDGEDRNIVRDGDGRSTLTISRKSDLDLINQVKVTYDDRSQDWIETPLRPVEDEAAQLRAGRILGDTTRKINSKSYKLLGVDYEPQAVKVAWSLLDLGEFDEGGLKNNLELKFKIWYIDSLDLYPTKVIRVVSSRLDKYLEPGTETPFRYFRVKKMARKSDLQVELTVQAYAKEYMDDFEHAEEGDPGGEGGYCTLSSQCPDGYQCVNGVCVPILGTPAGGCGVGISSVEYRDGVLSIVPVPCTD